jgi:hypothetical protein
MVIEGTRREKKALAKQLGALYEYAPDIVLSGSFGRAIMYCAFGYEAAPPLPLKDTRYYRDLDICFAPSTHIKAELWEPHPLDRNLSHFVDHTEDGNGLLYAYAGGGRTPTPVPVRGEVLRPVRREFLGAAVLTFAAGTQQQMEKLVPPSIKHNEANEKCARSAAVFADFADSIRAAHPEEFLPPECYAPFDEVSALNRMTI